MFIDYGPDLPVRYGENMVYLLPLNPETLFVYWEVQVEGQVLLRLKNLTAGAEQMIKVNTSVGNWYVHGIESGSKYVVEMGIERDGNYSQICSSMIVVTPAKAVIPTVPYIRRG
jgi:hypothetical protein